MNSSMSTGDADCCASVAEAIPALIAESVVRRIITAFNVPMRASNALGFELMFRMTASAYSAALVSSKGEKSRSQLDSSNSAALVPAIAQLT